MQRCDVGSNSYWCVSAEVSAMLPVGFRSDRPCPLQPPGMFHPAPCSWCFRLSSPQHMERLSMLAFHPVKMQSCYEKVEQLNLEGLQQRFDISSTSVFISRAQILMRQVRGLLSASVCQGDSFSCGEVSASICWTN